MSIAPEGEEIRRATAWIGQQRQLNPQASLRKLTEEACIKFDLSPLEAEFLNRTLSQKDTP